MAVLSKTFSRGFFVQADTDPAVTDDYPEGSVWVNQTTSTVFICRDDTVGAARWEPISRPRVNVAAVDPVVTDDVASGYQPGDLWINSTDTGFFVCIDASAGAANWDEVTTT